jgi:hypothetical protein
MPIGEYLRENWLDSLSAVVFMFCIMQGLRVWLFGRHAKAAGELLIYLVAMLCFANGGGFFSHNWRNPFDAIAAVLCFAGMITASELVALAFRPRP